VTGEHVLGTLVPLETDQRHRGEVRFSGRDERVMQCVGFGTRRGPVRALAVLEAFERIVQRDNAWVKAEHRIPGARHPDHAEVGLAEAALDARAALQFHVEMSDAFDSPPT
jgi:hypothetical protein